MSTTKTIDISKLSEAQQNLFKSLFEQFCERSEPKEEKANSCGLKNGDMYYYITNDGQIGIAKWQGRASDFRRLALGNVFKTEKDTEFAREKQKIKVELEQYAKEHNDPEKEEWNGINTHYTIRYDIGNEALVRSSNQVVENINDIYFTSEDIVKNSVDYIGAKRIMKYLFNVDCEVDE